MSDGLKRMNTPPRKWRRISTMSMALIPQHLFSQITINELYMTVPVILKPEALLPCPPSSQFLLAVWTHWKNSRLAWAA